MKNNIISDWLDKQPNKEMDEQVEREVESMFTGKVFNEDCLITMNNMPDNFIDLTVTSPPYDNLRTYNGYSFDFENVAKELFRVTKEGCVVVWIVGDATVKGSETGTSFKQALFFKDIGFNLHDTMIYHKLNPMPVKHNRYMPAFEYMFVLSKGKPKNFNPIYEKTQATGKEKYTGTQQENGKFTSFGKTRNKDRIKYNLWSVKVGSNQTTKNKIAFKHPAIFPEQLANDHIISWSNENDIVYDPFMGSGTTAKMAILNNRRFIGSEMSSDYCDIIKQRLKETISQTKLNL